MTKKRNTEPEYRLRVFHTNDERFGQSAVVVAVETIKEFVNFNYEILLEERKTGNTLHLKILGLHTPASIMPGVGPARGVRVYPHLQGQVTFIVAKPDGQVNQLEVDVNQGIITLRQMPEQPFLIFSSEPVPLQ